MRRKLFVVGAAAAVLLAAGHDSLAQRGGRGGGARAGGAVRGGAVAGPYGGAGAGSRSAATVVGPGGGSRTVGSGRGSYTTQRGSTINYAGAGARGTTAGGVNYGRGVGGVQVTTPGGQTATRVGRAGGVAGPGGNAVGSRGGVTVGSGPGGSFSSAHRGGVAVGPHGAVAGGGRVGTATGPGGTVSGATRGAAAVGPYGAAAYRGGVAVGPAGAVGGRTAVARGAGGTYYASRTALATTGGAVRSGFRYYGTFTPGWYARYPGAWAVAGWTAARVWSAPAWGSVATYCGYPAEPVYYDYGSNVVYQGDTVYMDGNPAYTAEAYTQQAADLAAAGKAASAPAGADDWQPLGVFALVQGEETTSSNVFQLAVSKDGVIRGNYYNALTDTTETVYGSVNQQTKRAAWTVGDRKAPVFDTGIANLTRDETTVLVHSGTGEPRQLTLVRVKQPEGGEQPDGR